MLFVARIAGNVELKIGQIIRRCVLAFGIVLVAASPGWREEDTSVAVPGGTLYGTLTIPEESGPFPVALIIAGSGPTDRDGNQLSLHTDAYKLLAHGLAARGIATLRYDKRWAGKSDFRGQREEDARFETLVDDALAFVAQLKSDPRFRRIYLIGHSEGSLIGILAAQRDPSLAGLVSLEGAGRNAADVLVQQYRDAKAAPSDIATVQQFASTLRAGKTNAQVSPYFYMLFRPSVQPYLISWFRYDPAQQVSKVKMPVLIVQGTTDVQVGIEDAQRLKAADTAAQLALITGMNHILRDAPAERAANLATYAKPSLPLNAELVSTIANFILSSR